MATHRNVRTQRDDFDMVTIRVVSNGYEVGVEDHPKMLRHDFVFESFANLTDWLADRLIDPPEVK